MIKCIIFLVSYLIDKIWFEYICNNVNNNDIPDYKVFFIIFFIRKYLQKIFQINQLQLLNRIL